MHKILIVDDESLFKEGFIHMADWEALGFAIIGEAANGAEALDIIKLEKPDIVVTDIKMPIMDGIELTKAIKEKYAGIQVVALSSYDEFDYVKGSLKSGAIDYILKAKTDKNELIGILKKIRESSPREGKADENTNEKITLFFNSIVNNNICGEELNKQIEGLNISISQKNLLLVLFYSDEDNAHFNKISNYVNDDLSPGLEKLSGGDVYSILYRNNVQVFIINCNDGKLPAVHKFLREITGYVNENHDENAYVISSGIFQGYENICDVFQKTLLKCSCAFYQIDSHVITEERLSNILSKFDFDMEQVNKRIEKFEFTKLPKLIEDYTKKMINSDKLIDPYVLKRTLCEIYYMVLNRISELGYDIEKIAGSKTAVLKRIDSAKSFKDVFKEYGMIFEEIEFRLKQSGKFKYSQSVGKIVEYIHENYSSNISLASIAEKFHLNKSYLCNLFKRQTGKNYNDYIAEIRVAKAQKLLRSTDMQISEICCNIGISNQSYFTKVFKKYVGMTPTEYSRLPREQRRI